MDETVGGEFTAQRESFLGSGYPHGTRVARMVHGALLHEPPFSQAPAHVAAV